MASTAVTGSPDEVVWRAGKRVYITITAKESWMGGGEEHAALRCAAPAIHISSAVPRSSALQPPTTTHNSNEDGDRYSTDPRSGDTAAIPALPDRA